MLIGRRNYDTSLNVYLKLLSKMLLAKKSCQTVCIEKLKPNKKWKIRKKDKEGNNLEIDNDSIKQLWFGFLDCGWFSDVSSLAFSCTTLSFLDALGSAKDHVLQVPPMAVLQTFTAPGVLLRL